MGPLLTFLQTLNPAVAAAVVSAATSAFVLLGTSAGKLLYDRYSLGYKLEKEFAFSQKKHLKEEISKTKMKVLNAAEELNFRLWNFASFIEAGWHNKPPSAWADRTNYYFHSFVYRLLGFLYLIFESEKSILTYDSTIFPQNDKDIEYLKHIKSFKNYFCDLLMLKEFNYGGDPATDHFFKDYLGTYITFIADADGNVIGYAEYLDKIEQNYDQVYEIMRYISEIEKDSNNIKYNVMMGFHLMLLTFLNKYGHDYQITIDEKIVGLIKEIYHTMKNREGFINYLVRCKIHNDFGLVIKNLRNGAKGMHPRDTDHYGRL